MLMSFTDQLINLLLIIPSYSIIQSRFLRICFVETAAGYRPLLFSTQASDELPDFMNGPVRDILGIIPPEVTWQTSKFSIPLSSCFYAKQEQSHRLSSREREDPPHRFKALKAPFSPLK